MSISRPVTSFWVSMYMTLVCCMTLVLAGKYMSVLCALTALLVRVHVSILRQATLRLCLRVSIVCPLTPLYICFHVYFMWHPIFGVCLMSVEIALGRCLLLCFMSLCLTFVAVLDCASNPCRNGATCYDRYYGFSCSCRSGFTGSRCEVGESNTSCSSMFSFPVISVSISLFPFAVSFWQLHCAVSVTCT